MKQFLLLLCGLASIASAAKPATLTELRALRHEAANRQRRVIFNNDGSESAMMMKTASAQELLDLRTSALAGTQVDSIFYCSRSSGFGVFTHFTKVGQIFTSQEGRYSGNQTSALLKAGVDPLRVMVDFSKQHNMESFWSMRMNDTHDGSTAEYGPIMFRTNKLKNEHPEWLISTLEKKPKFGAWSAVDFAHPEIRDLAFRYVEEVCQNYDVDGVELDFFRHPVFFKRAAMSGTECNDDERALMSDLLRRIRTMTETEGLRRGRPILLAVRSPDSVDYCRASGLDLEKWLAEGLFDLFIPGGYFRLNEWSDSIALGHKYGVKVYPSLDESRVRDPAAKKLRSSLPTYRGRALSAWQAGADGIYMFNYFKPQSTLWRELGTPATLAALDHDYFASILGLGAAAGGAYPHVGFIHVPSLNPARPISLKPGTPAAVTFDAVDETASANATITLRLHFKTLLLADTLTVTLNGSPLASAKAQPDNWLEFAIPSTQFKPGSNAPSASPNHPPVKPMPLSRFLCLLLWFTCSSLSAIAATETTAPPLPKILLMGSTKDVAPLVAKKLAGKAAVVTADTVAADKILAQLEECLLREKPAVVHFQNSPDLDETTLQQIIARFQREPSIAFVVATAKENDATAALLAGVPVHDLRGFDPQDNERTAEAVADCVMRQWLVLHYSKPGPTRASGPEAAAKYRAAETAHDAEVPEMYKKLPIGQLTLPKNAAAWKKQRPEVLSIVKNSLGDLPPRPAKTTARVVSRELRRGYTLERVSIDNGEDNDISALVLIPEKRAQPAPAILWLHSSTPDKNALITPGSDPESIGEAFVRNGYVVLAPDAWYYGDRAENVPSGPRDIYHRGVPPHADITQNALLKLNLWMGRTVWGMMVRDDQIALDYLCQRPEVDATTSGGFVEQDVQHIRAAPAHGGSLPWMSASPPPSASPASHVTKTSSAMAISRRTASTTSATACSNTSIPRACSHCWHLALSSR